MFSTCPYVDVSLVMWLPEVNSLVDSSERVNEPLCRFYLKVSFAGYKMLGSYFLPLRILR